MPAPKVASSLFVGWRDLVGPEIAAHTRPLLVRDGVLTVGVDQPAWAVQLRYLSATLLAKVQEDTGDEAVRQIRVKVLGEDSWRRRRGAQALW